MRTLVCLVVALASPSYASPPPLIPRAVLLGNPERAQPLVSPDGKKIIYGAPDKNDVMQVWVRTLGARDDRMITADRKRGIRTYAWGPTSTGVLYLQDSDGDENFHVFLVDLDSGNVRDLTPFQGVRASIVRVDPAQPGTILVGMNVRDRSAFDVWRVDLRTGATTLAATNPGDVVQWFADADGRVRGALATPPDGTSEVRVRVDEKSAWRRVGSWPFEENIDVFGFTPDGEGLYLGTSAGGDTERLVAHDLAADKDTVLVDDPTSDIVTWPYLPLVEPRTHRLQAIAVEHARVEWVAVDPAVKADLAAIAKLQEGDASVVSRDHADTTWTVAVTSNRAPTRYYVYHRATRKGELLYSSQPKLDGQPLADTQAVDIRARDGMLLHAYLTLPVGVPGKRLPLVVAVHGGPWDRAHWLAGPDVQLLANRGYAVLRPNFRSSTGYGKKFLHAGDRQWGRAMQDDLTDAVKWAVQSGLADPARVAIYGGSYGGYAALAGATFTPDLYRCAVDVFGPTNLPTLLRTIPPYWKAIRARFDRSVGNVDDPKDAPLLHDASPVYFADRIKIPLLVAQGGNDPRVKPAESEQIVAAIAKSGGAVTYVLYGDEGHGFQRPANREDFNARMERFLAQCLGGRYEPMTGERIAGSSAVVRVVEPRQQ